METLHCSGTVVKISEGLVDRRIGPSLISPAFWGQSQLELQIVALLYWFFFEWLQGSVSHSPLVFGFGVNSFHWKKAGRRYLLVHIVLSGVVSQAVCYWVLCLVWLWNVSDHKPFIILLGLLFHLTGFTDRRVFLIILVTLSSGFVISDSISLWNMWVISEHFQKIPFQIGRQREFKAVERIDSRREKNLSSWIFFLMEICFWSLQHAFQWHTIMMDTTLERLRFTFLET